tara:strand:+ start:373 stop:738 length:366 start_codon:yes stop_codon:yes gene_type:complete
MSNNVYNPGLYHMGAYQVSGRPFGATGSLDADADTINFPYVTKQIVVLNRDGTDSIYAYFHTGSADSNKFLISAGEQQTFDVKCKMIILSSSADPDYTLYASLTAISSSHMYNLTGSGVTE